MIDFSIFLSLALLFGIAAQFTAMNGFEFLRALIAILDRRVGVLYAVVLITALFSPFVLNDVVILMLTPVLVKYAKEFKVDIAILLVAEITFVNIASSLTPLGNPQNILLWQSSGISASQFVSGTWIPLTVSGLLVATGLVPFRQQAGRRIGEERIAVESPIPAFYLLAVAFMVFSLDLLRVSNILTLAIAFSSGFFFTYKSATRVAKQFDFRSLLVLCLLVGAVDLFGTVIRPALSPYVFPVVAGAQPYSALFVLLLSNIISNVPATQLILTVGHVSAHVAPRIAVEAGLAGNLDPIASFANVLALLIVKRSGLPVRRAVLLQLGIGVLSFLPALI